MSSMRFSPPVDERDFFDPYDNICTRLVAPPGLLEVRSEFAVEDRRSAIMPMTGSKSATTTRGATVPRQRGMRNAGAFCRDFAHLAVTLSRCMNIPARYCTGYLGDIAAFLPIRRPVDFSAWYDVFLDGRWFIFDARQAA